MEFYKLEKNRLGWNSPRFGESLTEIVSSQLYFLLKFFLSYWKIKFEKLFVLMDFPKMSFNGLSKSKLFDTNKKWLNHIRES